MEDFASSSDAVVQALAGPSHSTSPPLAAKRSAKGKQKVIEDDERQDEHLPLAVEEHTDDDEEYEEDESYEERRQRQIQENRMLFAQLGLPALTESQVASSASLPRTHSHSGDSPVQRKKQKHKRMFDRSGHILSIPGPGEKQRMACVEMPSDRRLLRRIADGEYQDRADWAEGEDWRWKFGRNEGVLGEGERAVVGGVGPDFRWRRWQGLARELRREMKSRGELNVRDMRPELVQQGGEVSAYSLIPGDSCHQCRRKSEKEKMRCRNVDPLCRASFCETCCKRYSYFEFDPFSRSFICPLCKDCCNCSNCIRKRNLAHILEGDAKGVRTKSLSRKLREDGLEDMTVEAYVEQVEERVAPFDRVRLVDQATDVISPDLPPEEVVPPAPKERKRKKKSEAGGGKVKMPRKSKKANGEERKQLNLIVKIRNPSAMDIDPPLLKEKEVDSDGDTVGGYSDDDAEQEGDSPLTELSPTPVPRRLPFPPRSAAMAVHQSYLPSPIEPATASPTKVSPFGAFTKSLPQIDTNVPAAPQSYSLNGLLAPAIPASSPSSTRSSPDSVTGGKKRRKPPPKANIFRAPRKNSLPLAEMELPRRASDLAQAWNIEAVPQIPIAIPPPPQPPSLTQNFSYTSYTANFPQHRFIQSYPPTDPYLLQRPPPYSHSPPRQPIQQTQAQMLEQYLQLDSTQGYQPLQPQRPPPQTQPSTTTYPQSLHLLSLAAAEAQSQSHSPNININMEANGMDTNSNNNNVSLHSPHPTDGTSYPIWQQQQPGLPFPLDPFKNTDVVPPQMHEVFPKTVNTGAEQGHVQNQERDYGWMFANRRYPSDRL